MIVMRGHLINDDIVTAYDPWFFSGSEGRNLMDVSDPLTRHITSGSFPRDSVGEMTIRRTDDETASRGKIFSSASK